MNDAHGMAVTKLQEIAESRIAEARASSPALFSIWATIGPKVGTEIAIRRVLMSLHDDGAPVSVPLAELACLLGKDIAEKNIETLGTEGREEPAEMTAAPFAVGVKVLQLLLRSLVLFVIKSDAAGNHFVSLHPEWATRLPLYEPIAA